MRSRWVRAVLIVVLATSLSPIGSATAVESTDRELSYRCELIATKLGTQPLRGRFDIIEPNKAESLVGRTCVITTSDVTDRFGQARVEAEAAPLLLNVRGKPGAFRKNDPALITGYDTERGVFLVEPIPSDHLISEPPHPEAV